ncbi:hypothetical protein MMC25_006199 [Agyrium rufum]|nr:hypothetical protein [Agyrium rufum]
MARGRRGRAGGVASGSRSKRKQSSEPRETTEAEIYRGMLFDTVAATPSQITEDGRAVKKRRVKGRLVSEVAKLPSSVASADPVSSPRPNPELDDPTTGIKSSPASVSQPRMQTAYKDDDSAGSLDESDTAWEEVGFEKALPGEDHFTDEEKDDVEGKDLDLTLGSTAAIVSKRVVNRRKPASALIRKLRLDVHKLHVLSLISHVYLRNHWCNDDVAQVDSRQKVLSKLLSKKLVVYLNPKENDTQFQRSRSFMEGLTQVTELFRAKFRITARGMSTPKWNDPPGEASAASITDDIDLPMEKSDFRNAAEKFVGSRDIAAQLFCTILRSAGVEARLVCSLQVLPIQPPAKGTTPSKPPKTYAYIDPGPDTTSSADETGNGALSDVSVRSKASVTSVGSVDATRIRSRLAARLGRPLPSAAVPATTAPLPSNLGKKPIQKPIRESACPVYWVEAFNAALQKWIPIDILTTMTINKPMKLCPPMSDPSNTMTYVLAFEEDSSMHDVTVRYAQSYNAKTRRLRVEDTKGGERWWKRVIKFYKRDFQLDRDQLEEAELQAKEAREEMPRNVADFKRHPYFALERHLKRNEVLHPKNRVGKVSAGKSSEIVYRRKDVHVVRSADGWYRLGREIKEGEQPLKRVPLRRRRDTTLSDEDVSETELTEGTAMYAPFQTTAYVAPPVVNGRIPKNAFGNLDIYVPSMVPPGGVHIPHPDTSRAAKTLGIDYADAVTGFEFKGRHGTAVVKGAVFALEYKEAILAIIQGFHDERMHAEHEMRSREALRMWRRLLKGLRIRERIEGYDVEGEERDAEGNKIRTRRRLAHDEAESEEEEEDDGNDGPDGDYGGGGFFPDAGAEEEATTFETGYVPENYTAYDMGGGFVTEELEDVSVSRNLSGVPGDSAKPHDQIASADGGGFLAPETDEQDFADGENAMRDIEMAEPAWTAHSKLEGSQKSDEGDDIGAGGGFIVKDDPAIEAMDQTRAKQTLSTDESPKPRTLWEVRQAMTRKQLSPEPLPEEVIPLSDSKAPQVHNASDPTTGAASTTSPTQVRSSDSQASIPPTEKIPPRVQATARGQGLQSVLPGEEEPLPIASATPSALSEAPASPVSQHRAGSEESKGSLLSEDPEDEEMEPDWVN